jgi:uncharacterized protein involved in type VI secretion and phage assembly
MTRPSEPRAGTSWLGIKIDGQPLADDVFAQIFDVTVEQDLILPDSFAIRIQDIATLPDEQRLFPLADADTFKVGREVEILMGLEAAPRSVLKGEITSLELEMRGESLPMLTVRGYDRSHRMHRQKKTAVFVNKKVSDIVRQVAGSHGLSASVADTRVVYSQVFQDNQTDWELVRRLARVAGKEAHVTGTSLQLRETAAAGQPVQVVYDTTLRSIRLRMSASPQVTQVEVRGWDPRQKRAIVGTASTPVAVTPKDSGNRSGALIASSAFGAGKYVVTDQIVTSVQDANQRAQSILDEIAGGFVQLELDCAGDEKLRPGAQVRLQGVSTRFDGTYYISSARHTVTPDRGYETSIFVKGREANSISALMPGNGKYPSTPPAARSTATYPGVVIAVVTNNKDPEMGGRVKVKYPWLHDQLESDWIRLATPMAGNGRGFYWLPEINDEVLVAFEHGDINRPYVIGALWNGMDKPPSTASQVVGADGKVNKRVIKSRSGHIISIDDTLNQENITIVDKTGNNTIKLESPTNKLTISVNGDMVLEALNGNISMKGRTVAVEALQGLTMKGVTVNAEATQAMTVKGTTTQMQGTSQVKVSGATAEVQAQARLALNGGAMTEVKGGIVRLN